MELADLADSLSGAHAACDAAWARVDAACAALLAPHDAAAHERLLRAWVRATDEYEAAGQRLAVLTQQLLPALKEAA